MTHVPAEKKSRREGRACALFACFGFFRGAFGSNASAVTGGTGGADARCGRVHLSEFRFIPFRAR